MKLFLRTKDFSVSGESFELHHDQKLDMLITKPQPEDLDRFYESETYISHTDSNNALFDRLYQWVKRYSISKKLQLIDNQIDKRKTLLDVGAGTGDFVKQANARGFVVEGIEPNDKARSNARQKGVILHPKLGDIADRKFQIITLWHVLEHLPNLNGQIENLNNLLEPNGVLFIAVPNFKSFDAAYYGKYWAAYDVPRHLWHFSKKAISKIIENYGLKVIKVKPMLFDAFYVSLLSEKYKGNKLYWFNAFFIGLWSNISAFFSKEYSSHIYIIKKRD